ncbi:MAG: SAM-dependent methyltransferase [Azospirillum sp.]|nr:SAM-dependent methyltransferase [Azospirillum sp.]
MSPRTITLTDPVYDYLIAHSVREPAVLAELRRETQSLGGVSRMQIGPEQGQFMALMVELTGARRVIEVGTFTGYSALAMALALPPGGRVIACDVSREWTAIGRRFWQAAGVAERIELRVGPALETLDGLIEAGAGDGFDLAFIDADKPNYINYYERLLLLVRPGGVILVDNVLWSGAVADPSNQEPDTVALRAFNDHLMADDRISLSLLPLGDGLTVARRR